MTVNICVIGAGYVGLTTAAVLAELGHEVNCVDTNEEKIAFLNKGKIPIYEPELERLINTNCNRLTFSDSLHEYIPRASIIFIAVGTPSLPDGSTDLSFIHSVINELTDIITTHKTIITKSTVPPGTNDMIYEALLDNGLKPELFNVVSNPEFLKEGSAIHDMLYPDKIVVGLQKDDHRSLSIIKEMYSGIKAPYIVTSLNGAEMIKYASNAFLATKISFINEIARICEAYHVDVKDVAKGIGTDPRIGAAFLQAGIGYGGSCFPKDVRSLEYSATAQNVEPLILQSVQSVNNTQVDVYLKKLHSVLPNLQSRRVAVLGIAFKPNTDDTRFSPAVKLIEQLDDQGCEVYAYDPKAKLDIPYRNYVTQQNSIKETIQDADCVIITTDWNEFKELDWREVRKKMKGTIILDARNCLDSQEIEKHGLRYIGVGR